LASKLLVGASLVVYEIMGLDDFEYMITVKYKLVKNPDLDRMHMIATRLFFYYFNSRIKRVFASFKRLSYICAYFADSIIEATDIVVLDTLIDIVSMFLYPVSKIKFKNICQNETNMQLESLFTVVEGNQWMKDVAVNGILMKNIRFQDVIYPLKNKVVQIWTFRSISQNDFSDLVTKVNKTKAVVSDKFLINGFPDAKSYIVVVMNNDWATYTSHLAQQQKNVSDSIKQAEEAIMQAEKAKSQAEKTKLRIIANKAKSLVKSLEDYLKDPIYFKETDFVNIYVRPFL
jgi:hypothetical protein